jgi:type IV pilus assembly protein PilA
MKSMQKGFTLIELMIVVAIIAILAAIAIPAYQDYLIRTQVSEGAVLTDGAKTAVAEFYSNRGTMPAANDSAGLAAKTDIKGKYVTQVEVVNGLITATFGNEANDKIKTKTFILSPTTNVGSISWTCRGGNSLDPKYLPSSCKRI